MHVTAWAQSAHPTGQANNIAHVSANSPGEGSRQQYRQRPPRIAGRKKKRAWLTPARFIAMLLNYLVANTHFTRLRASASLTCGLAGIGTGPQAPEPPFMTLATNLSSAPL